MKRLLLLPLFGVCLAATASAATSRSSVVPEQPARLFPLSDVRVLGGPFDEAVKANRRYLLAHSPERLLAPYLREAGIPLKAQPYGNWESDGLDGHTAGHYLSALASMIAAGDDADGELRRRLDSMIEELDAVQRAHGDGYLGGVPGGKELWRGVGAGAGNVQLVKQKWVPWYNLHKMFAGLRDAYLLGGNERARQVLIRFGDWCDKLTGGLTEAQMQEMLSVEYGGMNEVLADIYSITGERKYLRAARRFNHHSLFAPLERREDRLTGLHANTQIPKIAGMERIAALDEDPTLHVGAEFFWETVTRRRTTAFGGNSVSEHFNDPQDFSGMVKHREGPETCNTYNMLRLTEELFAAEPKAEFVDYYERALYNHILASIHPQDPGYVYFTPIRPGHYRVYSQPEQAFWCCVGTGMENPGRYGAFIYARATDGLYVNLFLASELTVPELGLVLRQDTAFPDEEGARLTLKLAAPRTFTLHLRQPGWVTPGTFTVVVNGQPVGVASDPSSFVPVRREWSSGDRVELRMPMRTTVESLPDGSPWYAIRRGPIVLASPSGTRDLAGLRADGGRMGHVAAGPVIPLDEAPVLLADARVIPSKVVADPAAGPLHFRLLDIVEPPVPGGLPLVPFFRLHDTRYQMYWETTTREGLAARKAEVAAAERVRAALEAATIDKVAPGEQQPEVEHGYRGEESESGLHNGRRWRHGRMIEYALDTRGARAVTLSVTYSGDDSGRVFDIFANGALLATEELVAEKRGEFIEKVYPIPGTVLASSINGRVTVRFVARKGLAGGLYDVRLVRPGGVAGR